MGCENILQLWCCRSCSGHSRYNPGTETENLRGRRTTYIMCLWSQTRVTALLGLRDTWIGFIYPRSRGASRHSCSTRLPPAGSPPLLLGECLYTVISLLNAAYLRMTSTMALSTLPTEIQLCILQHLSTRKLLCKVTRLSKDWFYLACELIRQRTVRLLGKPGVSVVVSIFYVLPFPTLGLTIPFASSVRNKQTFRLLNESQLYSIPPSIHTVRTLRV